MAHDPLGRDLRHVLVSLMDPLSTAVPQGECNGINGVARIGGRKLFVDVGNG
jgi:hypothetical protein